MEDLKSLLDSLVSKYNDASFIEDDPICIPHSYSLKQDIEITAFWTSILAWGQRKTIINKATELFERMDNSPHDFIVNHKETDLQKFLDFSFPTLIEIFPTIPLKTFDETGLLKAFKTLKIRVSLLYNLFSFEIISLISGKLFLLNSIIS